MTKQVKVKRSDQLWVEIQKVLSRSKPSDYDSDDVKKKKKKGKDKGKK